MSQLHTTIKDSNKQFLDEYCSKNNLKQKEVLNRLLEQLKLQEENSQKEVKLNITLHSELFKFLLENYAKHSWSLAADFEVFAFNCDSIFLVNPEITVSREAWEESLRLASKTSNSVETLFITYLYRKYLMP